MKKVFLTIFALAAFFALAITEAAHAIILPSTPASPKAVSASYNSIKISWDKVDGATGYVLYRYSPAAQGYVRLRVLKTVYFTDTGLSTGMEYSYKVRAYTAADTNIYGLPSKALKAMPVPSVPGHFKSFWTSDTGDNLNWASVPGATGYVLYRFNPAAGAFERIKVTTAKAYTNTGLIKGTTYYYKVRAYRHVSETNIYGNPSAKLAVKAGKRAAPSVIVYNGNRNRAEIAFTFDDSGYRLGKMLDTCNRKGIKATFFLLSGELRANPKRWQAAVKQGFLICNHTTSHRMNLGKLSENEIRQDILSWEKACKDVLGEDYFYRMKSEFPYFRAPGGNSTKRLQQVLGDLGYKKTIYWTREDIWFKTHNPRGLSLVQNYVWGASNGGIFLMHGGSYGALSSVIDGVRARHFHIKLLPELLK